MAEACDSALRLKFGDNDYRAQGLPDPSFVETDFGPFAKDFVMIFTDVAWQNYWTAMCDAELHCVGLAL